MAWRRLFIPFGLMVLVMLAWNVLICQTAKKTQRHHLMGMVEQLSPDTGCVFLGNSLVEAGCDATVFRDSWPNAQRLKPVNLALGATTPVEHYLILKQALRRPFTPKYLIYGFFDDQLNAPVRGQWSDLVGNRALSYYFPDEAARFYAPGSRLKRWQLQLTAVVPMLAERSSLWGKIELLRRCLEEVGMPRKQTNRYGRVEDFAALESKDVASFNERCDWALRLGARFSAPVEAIVRLAQASGAKVILVEMPLPSRHRDMFYQLPVWTQMRHYLERQARTESVAYISASDWVQDDSAFEDATHLNEWGARMFSAKLANAIAQLEVTSQALVQ